MSETYEKYAAIRQGAQNHSSEEYFNARPQIDSGDRRKVFEAGFERAYDLREEELAALRDKCAELEKDVQVAKQPSGRMCSCIECVGNFPDGPEPDGWLYESSVGVDVVRHRLSDKFKAICPADMQEHQLYRLPPNLPAIIEQARKEERESALKIMRHAAAALAHAAESNPMYQDAYNEIDAAIRARKP